jgi:hypothetical protein
MDMVQENATQKAQGAMDALRGRAGTTDVEME